jgi:uncharacterized protein (TIGR00369 family)
MERNPYQTFGVVDRHQFASDSGLDVLRKMLEGAYPAPPFSKAADIWLVSVERGRAVFAGVPTESFYNPMGSVHGGWISALLDSAMGVAVHTMLKAGQGYTTIEMKANFVRPVFEKTGELQCVGTIVHFGGRVATSEGRVTDHTGALIAHGSETCLVFDVKSPA